MSKELEPVEGADCSLGFSSFCVDGMPNGNEDEPEPNVGVLNPPNKPAADNLLSCAVGIETSPFYNSKPVAIIVI